MQLFKCPNCSRPVFFENIVCLACGVQLVFHPDERKMLSAGSNGEDLVANNPGESSVRVAFSVCSNRAAAIACNWLVDDSEPDRLCRSCRLTSVYPNQK